MARIALIHFTGPPSPGAIERMLRMQAEMLLAHGHFVGVIVGSGEEIPGTRHHLVSSLHPSMRAEVAAPDVADILRSILAGYDQCWVHNVVTVTLHPAFTCALHSLMCELRDLSWAVWCEDISSISQFAGDAAPAPIPDGVAWVTISETRRREMAAEFRLDPDSIAVISPPVDAAALLGVDARGWRTLDTGVELGALNPLVVLPAKLLPHKCIDFALEVAASLLALGAAPLMLVTGASSPHEANLSDDIAASLRCRRRQMGLERHFVLLSDLLSRDPRDGEVRDCLARADVVFLPSAEEGFGLPLLEAGALRIPIVCRDLPVFREVGGETPHYFSAGDSAGRVAGMIMACDTSASRLRRRALASADLFASQVAALAARTEQIFPPRTPS